MDRSETAKIVKMLLSTLRLTRPIADEEALLAGWHLALSDIPYDIAERAAATILREEQYFPEPSKVRDLAMKELVQLPDADEAWRAIQRKLKSGCWPAFIIPSSAVDVLREAIDALGGTWALNNSERPERDREQFYRIWPQIVKRHQRQTHVFGMPVVEREGMPPGMLVAVPLNDPSRPNGSFAITEIEDRGIGLVDYENQPPKPIPGIVVTRQDGES